MVRGEIECEPSPANRISLSQQRDTFGNPGAQLTLDFTDVDRRTIAYTERLIWQLLAQFGVTKARVVTGTLSWAHHHMGTCRMGDNPRTSVVDRDLRVHGTPNLYVAGSAPFVTSGVSNPTLTITALSLRLAEHLTTTLRA
jgi:choline dehydrogenase-like flavoprotein